MTPEQLRRLATLATDCGNGSLRLTATQNIVILGIPAERIGAFLAAVPATGLALAGSPFQRGMVSCTGSEFCKLAITETKRFSIGLAAELEQRIPGFGAGLKLHVTGCPNSCGQHWIADVGLQGILMDNNGEKVEGYDVFLGGAAGRGSAIARRVGARVAATAVAPTLERLFRTFTDERTPDESFRSWAARTPDGHIRSLLASA